MKITFLQHSCFYIESGDARIMIDPFYDYTGFPCTPTHVIVTHAHADHVGNAVQLCKDSQAKFISTYEIVNWMKEQGYENTHDMGIGGFVDFGAFRMKFTHATHSSSIDGIHSVGTAAGVVLHLGGKTLYHAGDTGVFGDMRMIGERDKPDIAFLPIGGNYTMDIEDAVYATGLIKPKKVIPMHYNTFPVIAADAQAFAKQMPAGTECVIFAPGESKEFG